MAKIATGQMKNGAARRGTNTENRSADAAEIEMLAYQFFVERGYQHGYDQEDWTRAENIVKNRKRS